MPSYIRYNDLSSGNKGFNFHKAVIKAIGHRAAAQDNVSDAYFGMIVAEWCNCPPNNKKILHYVIQYTGEAADIGTGGSYVFTSAQMKQFEKDYQKKVDKLLKDSSYSINNGAMLNEAGLEKLFFDTLKNMGINGDVNLQKIDSNGSIINVNNNGIPTGIPCPI